MGRNVKFKQLIMCGIILVLPLLLFAVSAPDSIAQSSPFIVEPIFPESIYSTDSSKSIDAPASRPKTFSLEDVDGLETVSIIVTYDGSVSGEQIAANVNGEIVHTYKLIQGSSLLLAGRDVETVANMNGVTAVYLDELNQLQTDNSVEFIGAPQAWDNGGGSWNAGEDMVFATIDSGVWPEHASFSDPDPVGRVYTPLAGAPLPCDFGNSAWNSEDAPFSCNNKLIGAYQFMDTYKMLVGLTAEEFDSARDSDGHGTHTTAVAAGNRRVAASIGDTSFGRISGVAPRAKIIAYKACGLSGCYSSDVVAAVEQAILDEVDVINYAVGGGENPYKDFVSLAFLRAYEEGVFVSRAAGNDGPTPNTVVGRDPWAMTVGASTQDRMFGGTLELTAVSQKLTLEGVSISEPYTGRVVIASVFDGLPADDPNDGMCLTPFPAGTWTSGEIVVCKRGKSDRPTKGFNVQQGGAGALVLYNPTPNTLAADNHFLPAIHLQDEQGDALIDFLLANQLVTGTISGKSVEASQGNVMAPFSGRGGAEIGLAINKPDVTAPGVQILAGHTPQPATQAGGPSGELFQIAEGTSLSSAHVAGAALLLRQQNPDWSPGQIKSALMTTAYTDQLLREDAFTAVTHFDAGSGHIDLTKAIDPGITISASADQFRVYQDELWFANYPSIFVPDIPGVLVVERELKSELDYSSTWNVTVQASNDLTIQLNDTISLAPQETRILSIIIDASRLREGSSTQATIYLEEQTGNHAAHIPVTVVRQPPPVTIDHTCSPSNFRRMTNSDCTISLTNGTFENASIALIDEIPRRLRLVEGSVSGATVRDNKEFYFLGELTGAEPPVLTIAASMDAFPTYISLASLGLPVIEGVSDESMVNFALPEYYFAGDGYTKIGMSSNGYAVVGGGFDTDISHANQTFPDAKEPNNVLAPFWTDLNPSSGGNQYIGFLVSPATGEDWVVMEWEDVPNFDDGQLNTFQIWIGLNGNEQIYYAYDVVSSGSGGLVTVGAENAGGISGVNWFIDGAGTPIAAGDVLRASSNTGALGQTHQITYQLTGWVPGLWTNCAYVGSSAFKGIYPACETGQILP